MTNEQAKELLPDSKLEMLVRDESMIISQLMRSSKGEELRPMLVLLENTEKGVERIVVALAGMQPGTGKHEYLRMIGESVSQQVPSVAAAFLVSEAWMSVISPAEAWRAKQGGLQPASKRPNRVEIATVVIRTLDGRGVSAMAEIKGQGVQRVAGEWKFTSPSDYAKGEDNMLGSFFEGYSEGLSHD